MRRDVLLARRLPRCGRIGPWSDESGGFSIGELSRRTGVPVATLRTWEVRYGQPRSRRLPERAPSGTTRTPCVRVGQMLGQRAAGLSLDAAAARLDGATPRPGRSSRRSAPRIPSCRVQTADQADAARGHARDGGRVPRDRRAGGAVRRLPARVLPRPVLGPLARPRAGRRSSPPSLADFGDAPTVTDDDVVLRALGPDSALTREWLLVCDGPRYAACVVGREPAGQAGVAERRAPVRDGLDLDPQVVRSAARICAAHAVPHLPDGGAALEARLSDSPPPASRRPGPARPWSSSDSSATWPLAS